MLDNTEELTFILLHIITVLCFRGKCLVGKFLRDRNGGT